MCHSLESSFFTKMWCFASQNVSNSLYVTLFALQNERLSLKRINHKPDAILLSHYMFLVGQARIAIWWKLNMLPQCFERKAMHLGNFCSISLLINFGKPWYSMLLCIREKINHTAWTISVEVVITVWIKFVLVWLRQKYFLPYFCCSFTEGFQIFKTSTTN